MDVNLARTFLMVAETGSFIDAARKMNITGTVKVEVVVAPNGTVKNARLVGGHPVLAAAALDAGQITRAQRAALPLSAEVAQALAEQHGVFVVGVPSRESGP